jgi:hypothetical protein
MLDKEPFSPMPIRQAVQELDQAETSFSNSVGQARWPLQVNASEYSSATNAAFLPFLHWRQLALDHRASDAQQPSLCE